MKVGFDFQIFSLQAYGGISRYFVRLAEELERIQQTEAKLFAGFYINRYLREIQKKQVVGVGIDNFPWRLRNQVTGFNRMFGTVGMNLWRPNVIHETYYSSDATGPSKAQRVVTVYDMIHELFPEKFSPEDETSKFKRAAVKRADHVICISKSTCDDLVQLFGTSQEKISIIHLGCDPVSQGEIPTIPELQTADRPYLLYVGERSGYKNFFGMLKSVANSALLKSEFRIVCFGGGVFRQRETDLINALGFKENQVTQLFGDDEKLSALYAGAFAFVYPSMYEGFGLPPLEAMAHGCPVVTSQTSSMPEVVGLAGEYFDPADVDSISKAIENVVLHPTKRSELIALGQKRVGNFSWAQCANETKKIYDKLII